MPTFPPSGGPLRPAPCLLLVLLLAGLLVPAVGAEELRAERDLLPKGLADPMVVGHGGFIYALGGSKEGTVTRDILRIDPVGLSVSKVADLPAPRMAGAAAVMGGKIYVFGGANWVGGAPVPSSDIIVFNPANNKAETLVAVSLPAAIIGAAAATDGDRIYIFGGYQLDPPERRDQILEFNPSQGLQGAVSTHAARLPFPLQDAAVAYDGTRFVIAGGLSDGGEVKASVLWFRPSRSSLDKAPYELPTTLRNAAAIGREGIVHVAGGALDGARRVGSPAIMRLDATEVVNLTITLDPSRWSLGAARSGQDMVVVGGRSGEDSYSRSVVVMDARPSAASVATEPLQIVSIQPDPGPAPPLASGSESPPEESPGPALLLVLLAAASVLALGRRSARPGARGPRAVAPTKLCVGKLPSGRNRKACRKV